MKKKSIIFLLMIGSSLLASCQGGGNLPSSSTTQGVIETTGTTGGTTGTTASTGTSGTQNTSVTESTSGTENEDKEVLQDGTQKGFNAYLDALLKGNYSLSYEVNKTPYTTVSNESYYYSSQSGTGYVLLPSTNGKEAYYSLTNTKGKFSAAPTIHFDTSYQVDEELKQSDISPLGSIGELEEGDYPKLDEATNEFVSNNKKINKAFANLLHLGADEYLYTTKVSFSWDNEKKATTISFTIKRSDSSDASVRKGVFTKVGASKDDAIDSFISGYSLPETTLTQDYLSSITGSSYYSEIDDNVTNSSGNTVTKTYYYYSDKGAYYTTQNGMTAYYKPKEDGTIWKYALKGDNTLDDEKRNIPNSKPSYTKYADLTGAISKYFQKEINNFRRQSDGYFHYYGIHWNDASNLFKIQKDYRVFKDFYLVPRGGKIVQAVFVNASSSAIEDTSRTTTVNFLDPSSNPLTLPEVAQADATTEEVKEALGKLDTKAGYSYTFESSSSTISSKKQYISDDFVLTYDSGSSTKGTGYYQKAGKDASDTTAGLYSFTFDTETGTIAANGPVDPNGKLTDYYVKNTLAPELFTLNKEKTEIVQKEQISDIYAHLEIGGSSFNALMGETFAFQYDAKTKTITGATFQALDGNAKGGKANINLTLGYQDSGFTEDMKSQLAKLGENKTANTSWSQETGVVSGLGDAFTEAQIKAIPYVSYPGLDGYWQATNLMYPGSVYSLYVENNGSQAEIPADYFTQLKAKLDEPSSGFVNTGENNTLTDEPIYKNEAQGIYLTFFSDEYNISIANNASSLKLEL